VTAPPSDRQLAIDGTGTRRYALAVILLKTLGSTDLRAPDQPGAAAVLTQPKRLALLLYLLLSGRGGFVRRDTILALFWPDADQAKGRQALRQTVYLLRQSLGREVILSRGDEDLAISRDLVQCDALLFEDALLKGGSAEALERYRGDLLAGFHVPDAAPELEEWIERERQRLRGLATTAAWTLATAEEKAGNAAGAAYWARRAVSLGQEEEPALRDLMALLARVGDRPGALRAYEEYARRLREELGIEPGAELQRAAQGLRKPVPLDVARQIPAESVAPGDHPAPVPSSREQGAWLWGGVVVAVVLAAGFGIARILQAPPPLPTPVLAVGDIREIGGGDSSAAPAVAELLASSLARVEGLQVLSGARLLDLERRLAPPGAATASATEAARAGGATHLIRGDLIETPGEGRPERLELQVIDLGSGRIHRTLLAEGTEPFAVTQEAAVAVARAFGVRTTAPAPEVSSTPSLTAFRFYTEGLRAYYQNSDYTAARRLFVAALEEDSTFAMAALMAALSDELVTGRAPSPLLDRAVRLAPAASDRDRLLIRATWAGHQFDPAAMAYAETLAVRYPAEPAGHSLFAEAALAYGHFEAGIASARRVIAMDSLGLSRQEVVCRACEAYRLLATAYLQLDQPEQAEVVAREFLARQPANPVALGQLYVLLVRMDRFKEAARISDRIDSLAGQRRLGPADEDGALRAGDFDGADQTLEQEALHATPGDREDARWWLGISLRMQGRLVQAADLLEHGHTPGGRTAVGLGWSDSLELAQVRCEMGQGHDGAARFERIASVARPHWRVSFHSAKHLAWHLTHAASCLAMVGDTTPLRGLADTIELVGRASSWERDRHLHFYVRGLLAGAEGHTEEAITLFRQALTAPAEGFTRINYELAGALLDAGRPREAIKPLQAALRAPLEAGGLYLTRTEAEERLAQAFARAGQRDSARVHYAWVSRAWRRADPEFRARWDEASRNQ
jgi:DNA-binding SARP family transcriptional activator/predicted Zn-dependent protease